MPARALFSLLVTVIFFKIVEGYSVSAAQSARRDFLRLSSFSGISSIALLAPNAALAAERRMGHGNIGGLGKTFADTGVVRVETVGQEFEKLAKPVEGNVGGAGTSALPAARSIGPVSADIVGSGGSEVGRWECVDLLSKALSKARPNPCGPLSSGAYSLRFPLARDRHPGRRGARLAHGRLGVPRACAAR